MNCSAKHPGLSGLYRFYIYYMFTFLVQSSLMISFLRLFLWRLEYVQLFFLVSQTICSIYDGDINLCFLHLPLYQCCLFTTLPVN